MQKKAISYPKSIVLMISVIICIVLTYLIGHKIRHGTFIGDVPAGLYYFAFFMPTAIIIIGMLIVYYLDKTRDKA